MLEKIFKRCGSRGQALVFFALMIPMTFMFFGAAFEFGWWYLNQSRLQNAADAAVVAGAYKIKEESDPKLRLRNYKKVEFISNDDDEFKKFIKLKQTATVDRSDAEEYISYKDAIKYVKDNLPEEYVIGNEDAKKYAEDDPVVKLNEPEAYLVKDSKTVTEHIYYAVELSGTLDHLFEITKYLGEMPIKAVALTRLTQEINGEALLPQVLLHRDGDADKGIKPKIIYDWQRSGQTYSNPRTIRTTNGDDQASRRIEYTAGNTYRTEKIVLDGESGESKGSAAMENTGDKYWRAYAASVKNGKYEMDDMFIDFRPEIVYDSRSFKEDWDITMPALSGMSYQNMVETKNSLALRILATIDFKEPYKIRANTDSNGNEIKDSQGNSLLPTDPLYVRIESEPIYNDGITGGHSSVRQIIINVNAASDDPTGYNTKKDDEGNYIYRPLVIYYEGPEKLANTINPESTVRDSKPVIINLNADFRGIIVMDNSPVVINGNGHKFYGFVIAKEYKHVKTAADFAIDGYIPFTDADGNTMLVSESNLKTEEQIRAEAASGKRTVFNHNGVLVLIPDNKLTNMKDAAEFDTTTYIRPAYKPDGTTKRDDVGTDVYVRKSELSRIEETPIPGGKDKWYDFVKRSDPDGTMYCLNNVDNDVLLYSLKWRLVTDIDGNQKIVQDFETNIETTYDKWVGDDGGIYYINSSDEIQYYSEFKMSLVNSVYVDPKGEVQYREGSYTDSKTGVKYKDGAIVPSKKNTYWYYGLRDADKFVFDYERDFNLSESHYDRFEGVVPPRGVYYYLDEDEAWDNFFTTERADWIT